MKVIENSTKYHVLLSKSIENQSKAINFHVWHAQISLHVHFSYGIQNPISIKVPEMNDSAFFTQDYVVPNFPGGCLSAEKSRTKSYRGFSYVLPPKIPGVL